MLDTVLVMGTGSWGTAAAGLVSENARRVVMWAHSPEVAQSINEQHTNPRHLRDYVLPATIAATSDAAEAVRGADAIVIAVPSNHLRNVLGGFVGLVGEDVPMLVLTKGIEPGSHLLMTEVVSDVLGNPGRVAALSGPNHAEEVCQGRVSAAVVGSAHAGVSSLFQGLFLSRRFRVYRTSKIGRASVGKECRSRWSPYH